MAEAQPTASVQRAEDRADMFRLLVESVRDYAIFMLDPTGRVTSWNSGAAQIKGYTREEIIGKHFSIFYPPEANARRLPQYELEVAKERGRFEDEGWRIRRDGTSFWANVVITAMRDERGELRGFAKVTRDLTARRQFEELQKTERRMNEFLAMLSHELRNPLAPIQTALDVLERGTDNPATGRWARDIIQRQTHQLKRLVDDLLDVSRITVGRIELHSETVDLRTVVEQTVESWRPAIEARRQHLSLKPLKEAALVHVDPLRLSQTLSNLIANAVKYTPEGGRIDVRTRVGNGIASIQVADNGIGIAPDLLPRVFDLFVQGDTTLDRRDSGLGVGLTLAKRLTELIGGTLTAASGGPGKGSEFILGLPAVMPSESPVAVVPQPERVDARAREVIVVDDNRDAADSLKALLELMGHHAVVLYDGADVVRVASARAPDVMLLDIGLPGADGVEIARRLRRIPGLERMRLVACTGYGREEDARRIAAAGFDVHLIKPISAADLARVLAR